MGHSARQILDILDDAARNFIFPMLDNGYVYPAAARLNVYLSPSDWALVFETFGFSPRSGSPDVTVTTLASRIIRAKSEADFLTLDAYRNYLQLHPHDEQCFYHPIEDNAWIDTEIGDLVRLRANALTLRGQRQALPSLADYKEAGVALENTSRPQVYELCRALAHSRREEVLATPNEREANVPEDVVCLLVLDEWYHPDVVDPSALPSSNTTFQQLAIVLESGDPAAYCPAVQPNSHWSNWPEGGAL